MIKLMIMTQRLREELLDGVYGEAWDDAECARLAASVGALRNGDPVPQPTSAAERRDVEEELEAHYPVLSMIEFFGIEHLAS